MTTPDHEVREDSSSSRFTFDQFERMADEGAFRKVGDRVELLDGRIVGMAPGSDEHARTTADLIYLLGAGIRGAELGGEFGLRTDGTLLIGESNAPQPDVMVVRTFVGRKYAQASDAVLVIEVSLSTRADDLKVKAPLYARAGVPELWIVEPGARRIRILREPKPDGRWDEEVVVTEGAATPKFSSRIHIALSELF